MAITSSITMVTSRLKYPFPHTSPQWTVAPLKVALARAMSVEAILHTSTNTSCGFRPLAGLTTYMTWQYARYPNGPGSFGTVGSSSLPISSSTNGSSRLWNQVTTLPVLRSNCFVVGTNEPPGSYCLNVSVKSGTRPRCILNDVYGYGCGKRSRPQTHELLYQIKQVTLPHAKLESTTENESLP